MNKWLAFILFCAAVGLPLVFYSPWVGALWLATILLMWAASWVMALRHSWRTPHGCDKDWEPTDALYSSLPKGLRDWIFGEGRRGGS